MRKAKTAAPAVQAAKTRPQPCRAATVNLKENEEAGGLPWEATRDYKTRKTGNPYTGK